ncbi:hypothetical protein NDU88_004124 [Pleurodeles waltl]|uniref:Uncharacterized protein n=1 Tax=Pleurodeles waltl TaxID=8319 RepID=A0AAV7MFQ0_PLEWA|nr:hypothetical protein NDU88_004124 [Pleurodeles waltl]
MTRGTDWGLCHCQLSWTVVIVAGKAWPWTTITSGPGDGDPGRTRETEGSQPTSRTPWGAHGGGGRRPSPLKCSDRPIKAVLGIEGGNRLGLGRNSMRACEAFLPHLRIPHPGVPLCFVRWPGCGVSSCARRSQLTGAQPWGQIGYIVKALSPRTKED